MDYKREIVLYGPEAAESGFSDKMDFQIGRTQEAARLIPRISSILWTDWPALASAMVIPMVWLVGAVFSYLKSGASLDLFYLVGFALPLSVAAFGVCAWRVRRIFRLFATGLPKQGCITHVQIYRDRGRLEFIYADDGMMHASWMPVHKTKRVLALLPGEEVRVLVDPDHPERAILPVLFM